MDFDYDNEFADLPDLGEDFGLAKSFSSQSPLCIMPQIERVEEKTLEQEAQEAITDEVRADGFCFKLHPSEDQVQF